MPAFRYEDLDEVLARDDVDAVYVALPNTLHAECAVRAARAGVHVLTEKPMATSEEDCRRMIDAADENGVKLMVAYRLHFERANLEAIALIRAGRIGEPRFFTSEFSYQVKAGNIRTAAETGGGAIWDLATGAYRVVGAKGDVRLDPAFEYVGSLVRHLTVGERTTVKKYPPSDQFAAELVEFSRCVLEDRVPEPRRLGGARGRADHRGRAPLRARARAGPRRARRAPQATRCRSAAAPATRQGARDGARRVTGSMT